MNHLEMLETLLFLRGIEGISVKDIATLTGIKDFEYCLFLLSQVEEQTKSLPLRLHYNYVTKRFMLMISDEKVEELQEKDLVKSFLPRSVRATLSLIILHTIRKEPLTIQLLREERGKNVDIMSHISLLQKNDLIELKEQGGAQIIELTNRLLERIDTEKIVEKLTKLVKGDQKEKT
jgi:chromosome segregation and condensation protein ScpB